MKNILAVLLAVLLTGSVSGPAAGMRNLWGAATAEAQDSYGDYSRPDNDRPDYDRPEYEPRGDERYAAPRLSRNQLENLLAPVALYPDPLLAQILVAATFVDQIEDAAHFTRRYRDPYAIDGQPWDVSVKAVAHYPSVLNMMADRPDWTTALGQAYIEQPDDVMDSVQHLRAIAYRHRYLASNSYQQVIYEPEFIEIVPIQPAYIYVPVYDPGIIFVERVYFHPYPVITFGPPLLIGVWLNRDCDWRGHRIYYHGWRGDRVWIERSRPHVRITNVYVNESFRTVRFNRDVVRRSVNVENLNRFTSVHREANFSNLERRNWRERGNSTVENKTVRRDADRSRPGTFRGRSGVAQPATSEERSARLRQERSRTFDNRPPRAQAEGSSETRTDRWSRSRQQTRPPAIVERTPRTQEPAAPQGRNDRWSRAREERTPRVREPSPAAARTDTSLRAREGKSERLENRARRTREDRPPDARLRSEPPSGGPRSPQNGFRGEKRFDRPTLERGQAKPARVQRPAPSAADARTATVKKAKRDEEHG